MARCAHTTASSSDENAQVAGLTAYLPETLRGWPAGMPVIARRERPHPGAQLRLTDADGWRITCFGTNTTGWSIEDLEVRHRQRARAEDCIRNLKDTGLRNLPCLISSSAGSWGADLGGSVVVSVVDEARQHGLVGHEILFSACRGVRTHHQLGAPPIPAAATGLALG